MFEKTGKIILSGEEYPIKCDILVLEKIQEKYGDLSEFEGKIRKFVPDQDEKGNLIQNEEGLYVGHYEYPDITAMIDLLYWSVMEGAEIEGKQIEGLDRKTIMRQIDLSPLELSEILHKEYTKAFERKNTKTGQNLKTEES